MTIAIYNCIWTPLTVSFDYAKTVDETSSFLLTLNWCIFAVYTLDIVLQFLTSYINQISGEEVMKPSMIASRYLKGDFAIDFLSTAPFRMMNVKNPSFAKFAAMC